VLAAIQWENVHIAGAFLLGSILGSLATIRVMRAVLQTYEKTIQTHYLTRDAQESPPAEADRDSGLFP
jgi:uncharacterized membrane protein